MTNDWAGSSALTDAGLAAALAAAAWHHLVDLRVALSDLSSSQIKDEGDAAAQTLLATGLSIARPSDSVLSEEAVDDLARTTAERVWIIDPLDGTREFSEGRHDWAVHVALWERGDLTAGAVALPGIGELLTTCPAPPLPPPHPGAGLRMAVSRSRPPAAALAVADRLGAELVEMGSAGYKVAAVIRGEVDVYVHSGGQYEWDSAAPIAVARATGLHTSRVDGTPMTYNRRDPYLPDLVVCRPELAADVLAILAELEGSP